MVLWCELLYLGQHVKGRCDEKYRHQYEKIQLHGEEMTESWQARSRNEQRALVT